MGVIHPRKGGIHPTSRVKTLLETAETQTALGARRRLCSYS